MDEVRWLAMFEYLTKNDRVPPALRKSILERDGYRCVKCGFHSPERQGLLHIDHKHPKSKGGPTIPSNLRTLCGDCNMKKRNNVPECKNCGKWVVEDTSFCPFCSFPLQPQASTNIKKSSSLNPIVRRLLLALAVGLLIYSAGTIAYRFVSGSIGSLGSSVSREKKQTSTAGESCTIVDPNGKANLKVRCDSQDCDNDPGTVGGKIPAGTTITKTGYTVASTLSTVGEWTEVIKRPSCLRGVNEAVLSIICRVSA